MTMRYAFRRPHVWALGVGALALSLTPLIAADDATDLSKLAPDVLTKEQRKEAAGMIERDINRRSAEVNARNREEWAKIKTREQWEKYRDERPGFMLAASL